MSAAKPKKTSPVVKLALLGSAVIALFYLNQYLQKSVSLLQQLPVQGQTVEQAEVPPDEVSPADARRRSVQKTMHPLLVESREKARTLAQTSEGRTPAALDASFGRIQAQQEIEAKELEAQQAEQRAKEQQARAEAEARKAQQEAERLAKALPPLMSPTAGPGGLPLPGAPGTPPVDPFVALAKLVRVQAVMANGAIVNGGFFTVGQPVATLTYWDANGKKLHPLLHSVEKEQIELAEHEGKRRIVAKLRQ